MTLPMSVPNLLAVRRWPYETAFADRIFFECDQDDAWHKLHEELHHEFRPPNSPPDNKVTFELIGHRHQALFVTFHDNKVYVGAGVRPYRGTELPAAQCPFNPVTRRTIA